jgi:hypothetical protein
LYDWVALLWAAFGEFPARNCSPTSIIGGHSLYFRLQEPVLDKGDFRGTKLTNNLSKTEPEAIVSKVMTTEEIKHYETPAMF